MLMGLARAQGCFSMGAACKLAPHWRTLTAQSTPLQRDELGWSRPWLAGWTLPASPSSLPATAAATWLKVLWSWVHVQMQHAGAINSNAISPEVYCFELIAFVGMLTEFWLSACNARQDGLEQPTGAFQKEDRKWKLEAIFSRDSSTVSIMLPAMPWCLWSVKNMLYLISWWWSVTLSKLSKSPNQ